MAIYHLSASTGSRDGGQSAAKKFDYVARIGEYSRQKDKLVHLVSMNMPAWSSEKPREYWRSADIYERANGRLFKQIEAALPIELDPAQRIALAEDFSRRITSVPGGDLPFTLALHEGRSKKGESPNPHFHLVISERVNDGNIRSDSVWFKRAAVGKGKRAVDGGAPKTDLLKPKEWLVTVRSMWADMCNQALLNAGHDIRVDHRSFKDQGVDKPTPMHLGPTACAFEQRTGQVSRRRRDAEARAKKENEEIDLLQIAIKAAHEAEQEMRKKIERAGDLLAEFDSQEPEQIFVSENGFDLSLPRPVAKPVISKTFKSKKLQSGAVLHLRMPVDRVAFVEHKQHIRMSKDDAMDGDSISEALRVGCEKWGGVELTGSEEFKKLAFQKAAELGLSHFVTVELARSKNPLVI